MDKANLNDSHKIYFYFFIIFLLLFCHQAYHWSYTVDDAYISYRYSQNFADGKGLVFNIGERVEGYTNFTWVIILSVFAKLNFDIVKTSKFLGIFFSILILIYTYKTSNLCMGYKRSYLSLVPPLLLSVSPSFIIWSIAGLETMLFSFFLLLSIFLFIKETQYKKNAPFPMSSVTMVLATMTRPEGGILLLCAAVFLICSVKHASKSQIRYVLFWFATTLALSLPYMVWRISYFGYLLPNTFYAKTGRGIFQYMGGMLYTTSGIRNHGGLLFFIVTLIPGLYGPQKKYCRYPMAIIISFILYNIYKGHDVLPVFRFFVPVISVAYIQFAVFCKWASLVFNNIERFKEQIMALVFTIFLIGSIGNQLILSYIVKEMPAGITGYQLKLRIDDDKHLKNAKLLMQMFPNNEYPNLSIALIDAGVISYLTKWYVIDRWGLCDEHIAHTQSKGKFGEKYDEAYVLSKNPMIIQTHITPEMESKKKFNSGWAGDKELFSNDDFLRNYKRIEHPILKKYFFRRKVE